MKKYLKITFGVILILYFGFISVFGWFLYKNNTAYAIEPMGEVVYIYWGKLELERQEYDFSIWDKQIEEIEENNEKATIAIGFKLSEEECIFPQWYEHSANQGTKDKWLFQMIRNVVVKYRDNPVVAGWQIEINPLVSVEGCPPVDTKLLAAELELVEKLDKNELPISISYKRSDTLSAFFGWLKDF